MEKVLEGEKERVDGSAMKPCFIIADTSLEDLSAFSAAAIELEFEALREEECAEREVGMQEPNFVLRKGMYVCRLCSKVVYKCRFSPNFTHSQYRVVTERG